MSILSELNSILENLNIPVETSAFSNDIPEEYAVLTPLTDDFDLFADDTPLCEISSVRITLFSKKNYLNTKVRIVSALLKGDFTVTLKEYAGLDNDTGYHNYTIDVEKPYIYERE